MAWLWELPECASTNTWALKNLHQLRHGDIIYTKRQTAGRGRQGRAWISPAGVLTFSVVLQMPTSAPCGLTLAAGLAVLYAIEDLLPATQGILGWKWPNDLYAKGRKFGGLLTEATRLGSKNWVVVGIGLNRTAEYAQAPELIQAISLQDISQPVPPAEALIEGIRFYLLQAQSLCQAKTLTPLIPALHQRHILQGKQVDIAVGQEHLQGIVIGIQDRGQLELQLPSGEVRTLAQGHILRFST